MPGMTEHNVNIPMEDKQVEQAVGIRDPFVKIEENRSRSMPGAIHLRLREQLRKVHNGIPPHPH
jgi:hypothetical protein